MLSRGSRQGGATRRLAGARSRFGMGRRGVVARATAWVAWLGYSQGQLERLGPRIEALGRSARVVA